VVVCSVYVDVRCWSRLDSTTERSKLSDKDTRVMESTALGIL